jgi:hypothetical protein
MLEHEHRLGLGGSTGGGNKNVPTINRMCEKDLGLEILPEKLIEVINNLRGE